MSDDERSRDAGGPDIHHARQKRDWIQTVRQSLPVAWRVARRMAPTFELGGIEEIDAAFLERQGVRGVLWDVDGTLTHYHASVLAPEAGGVRQLFADAALRHAVVSNCDEDRYAELGRIFPDLPILKVYEVTGGTVGRRLERGRDLWFPDGGPGTPEPPRGPMEPLRKPDARIIRFAVEQLGVPADAVLMVGDQYWTDVAGARMGGVRSAKVPTVGRTTFPAAIRAFQKVEHLVRRIVA